MVRPETPIAIEPTIDGQGIGTLANAHAGLLELTMLEGAIKLVTRDPLKRMMLDAPAELLRHGAERGVSMVAKYVLGSLIVNAPWHSGEMANAQQIRRGKYSKRLGKLDRERGVMAKRTIAVEKGSINNERDYYYPLAIEFGWDDKPEGEPWLRRTLEDDRSEAFAIYRREMTHVMNNGIYRRKGK